MSAITVYVCRSCRAASDGAPPIDDTAPRPGALLLAATEAVAAQTTTDEVTVVGVDCLANCSRGPSAALQGPDRWTYVFGGLEGESGATALATALIDGARLLADAADGLLPWRGRPEPLKRGLIARIPPLGV